MFSLLLGFALVTLVYDAGYLVMSERKIEI